MDRRGFFKLAGVAAAATFMTRFPLFPREPVPTPLISGEIGKYEGFSFVEAKTNPFKFEVGLLRVAGYRESELREVRASGYMRVWPESVTETERGELTVRAVFPTVTRGRYMVRGLAMYEKNGGQLLFWQRFDAGQEILMTPGLTLQTTAQVNMQTDHLPARVIRDLFV